MALRSAYPFTNDWSIFATAADLPNVLGATTQTTNLQVGDMATVGSVKYVCTVATPGAAVWTPLLDSANTGNGVILFEWNGTNLAQFDTPITHSRISGPAPPTGTVTPTVIADPLYNSGNVILLTANLLDGGWVLPILTSQLTLPAEFTVEAVYSRTATVNNAFAGFICYTGTTGSVNGMEIQEGLSASQGLYQSMVITDIGGGTGQGMSATISPTVTGSANALSTLRSVIQRQNGANPSQWTTRSFLQGDAGLISLPTNRLVANAALTTQWDGLNFTRLGLAVVASVGSPVVRVHSLRVWEGANPI